MTGWGKIRVKAPRVGIKRVSKLASDTFRCMCQGTGVPTLVRGLCVSVRDAQGRGLTHAWKWRLQEVKNEEVISLRRSAVEERRDVSPKE